MNSTKSSLISERPSYKAKMEPKQFKPRALREKTVEDLTKSVGNLRKELGSLKVSKVASGVASKLAKIRVRFQFF